MNPEKVAFGFFIVMALTLNFGFFLGDIDKAAHHNVYELMAAIFVNLVATVLKFGDRSQLGAVLLATSLVAVLQLLAAAMVWGIAVHVSDIGTAEGEIMASIVSLSGGALLANVVSVSLLVIETMMLRH
ncbi:MAG: hypothetical protein GY862_37890 [Gammaproteobacteria bacterium]|nr:hypothetical protein [Gammaproteobacteria bacterium]